MKINWGTGIVLAFVAFISFIMYFIITMSVDKKYSHDLVTEDYYGAELKYQDEIDKLNNARTLKTPIHCLKTTEGLRIEFPQTLDFKNITGKIFLYRPSNKRLDFQADIMLSKPYLIIPNNRLVAGRWNVKVDWSYKGTSYLFKKSIHY